MSVIDLGHIVNVDNKKTIKIGTKKVDVVFNDDFVKKLQKMGLKLRSIDDQYMGDDKAEEVDDMDDKELTDYVTDYWGEAHKQVIQAIDGVLGKGIGEELYKQYNNSTDAVAGVLNALQQEAEKSVQVEAGKNRAERRARYNKER